MFEKTHLNITKASGDHVPFSEEKIRKSLMLVGADDEVINSILSELKSRIYDGISTKKIYKIASALLKEKSRPVAAKYHLKRALMELGPSGYPFEQYAGKILQHQGYLVKTGEIIRGNCVNHEIDVIAEKGNEHFMIECKFHNLPGTVSDVKIPLYIQSRFKDVEAAWIKIKGHASKFHQGWVITNTRFTDDAIQYGTCAGLKLIGWDYPIKGSLKNQIDTLKLYPVTCLTTLSKIEKQRLLENKIVLCKEIDENEIHLKNIGIKPTRFKSILDEAYQLSPAK